MRHRFLWRPRQGKAGNGAKGGRILKLKDQLLVVQLPLLLEQRAAQHTLRRQSSSFTPAIVVASTRTGISPAILGSSTPMLLIPGLAISTRTFAATGATWRVLRHKWQERRRVRSPIRVKERESRCRGAEVPSVG